MFLKEARLGINDFSTLSVFDSRQRFYRSSFSTRCVAGFSLLNFWQQNSSILLFAVFGVIVAVIFAWLIFRRRSKTIPEIKIEAEGQAPEKDTTMIERQPDLAVRSTPIPGIYGKIEVLVGNQQINTYLVTDNPLTIGRDPAQALAIIQEAIVSKLHCSIFYRDGHVFVKDINSTNGTYVSEEKISEVALHDNDVVFLGKKGTIKIIYHQQ
jgi:hypothetical protein